MCGCTFACVLSDVDAELNDVSGEDLAGRTLLRATAQPLAVDERPVAAFSVLQVELKRTKKAGQDCVTNTTADLEGRSNR